MFVLTLNGSGKKDSKINLGYLVGQRLKDGHSMSYILKDGANLKTQDAFGAEYQE
jgi:hypothetical protein